MNGRTGYPSLPVAAGQTGTTRLLVRVLAPVLTLLFSVLAAPATSADLVVGQVAPLTGLNATNGVPLMQGIKLHFDYLNSSGGIRGKRIRFIVRDDGYKVSETVRQARELIDKENAIVLVTTLGTANNEALVRERVLSQSGIAMVGPRSGASSLYGVPQMFPIRASYRDETRAIVRQLTTIGISRIGAVYQDDSFGKDALEGVEQALKDNLLTLRTEAGFERNTIKVEKAVDTMIKANPQAIIMLGVTEPSAAFIAQFRTRGGTSQIICLSIVDPATLVTRVGAAQARGLAMTVVVPSPNKAALPLIKEIQRAREVVNAKDFKLTLNSIEGYIAAKVVAEALRRAGNEPSRASVTRALSNLGSIDVGGFIARTKPTAEEIRYVDLAVIGAGGNLLQ